MKQSTVIMDDLHTCSTPRAAREWGSRNKALLLSFDRRVPVIQWNWTGEKIDFWRYEFMKTDLEDG